MERITTNPYGVELDNRQLGAWAKVGRPAHEHKPWSLGFIASANRFETGFAAGLNTYSGKQDNIYLSAIGHRSFKENKHIITTGFSFMGDQYRELFNDWKFDRAELVPGVFGEYTFNYAKIFTVVGGLRADYHNLFGAFLSPRVHARYALNSKLTFRASAGRGQRTANIFAENTGIFTSSRKLIIPDTNSGTYGLRPEVAWNYGINWLYEFKVFRRSAQLTGDYYLVNFNNQAVVDMDKSARELNIYNLIGLSYSQTFQIQLNTEPVKRLHVRLAYRYFDVRTTYGGRLREQSLLAKSRGFANLEYSTPAKWTFDLTAQFTGPKRLPEMLGNSEAYQIPGHSPAYTIMHAQVSKKWKKWDFYAGGENLLNITQNNLIIDPANPFGEFFDASVAWGPSMGRMFYVGVRYELK
jgi:outer membrane receptor for ferrienterochelin and colicin